MLPLKPMLSVPFPAEMTLFRPSKVQPAVFSVAQC